MNNLTFKEFILNEMPLSSYSTSFTNDAQDKEGYKFLYGKADRGSQVYWDDEGKQRSIEGRFSKKDRTALSNSKTFKILEDRLALTGYKFNIIMFEGVPQIGSGRHLKWLKQAENYIKEQGIETAGHITFIKNGTSGHIMTPWMVLHTIGHAILNEHPSSGFRNIIIDIEAELCGIKRPSFFEGPNRSCMKRLGEIFMFASVQSSAGESASFLNQDELYHEFIAEYLWHGGKIRTRQQQDPKKDQSIKLIAKKIEDVIKGLLDMCVGKTIYDHLG